MALSTSTRLTWEKTGLMVRWKGPTAKTNVFLLGLVFWAFIIAGCLENDNVINLKGSRYYYGCAVPKEFIESFIARDTIKVLPWRKFKQEAWERKLANAIAFYDNGDVYLQEGFHLDTLYHEIAHDYELGLGRFGHEPPCWHTTKPYNYNQKVLNSFDGITLPG